MLSGHEWKQDDHMPKPEGWADGEELPPHVVKANHRVRAKSDDEKSTRPSGSHDQR